MHPPIVVYDVVCPVSSDAAPTANSGALPRATIASLPSEDRGSSQRLDAREIFPVWTLTFRAPQPGHSDSLMPTTTVASPIQPRFPTGTRLFSRREPVSVATARVLWLTPQMKARRRPSADHAKPWGSVGR